MDKTHFTLGEIADLLAVPRHNPKNWIRLHAEHPCFLPSMTVLQHGRGVRMVALDDFLEWLQRPANNKHRDRILALFAPQAVQEALPLARATSHLPHLRSDDPLPASAPVSDWWQVLDAPTPDHPQEHSA